jgi:Putative porin
MIRHISIILLLALSSGLYAQKPNIIPSKSNTQKQDSIRISRESNTHKQDTIKKPRILKEWTLSPDYSEEVNIPIDTVFSLSNRFKIADKYSPVNASLGNYGLPFYQLSFFDRITDPDKFLYTSYYPLMHLPSNPLFMNTQVPFTELEWSFAGPVANSEQSFRVRHSQNINRFINFGLVYDIVFSLGQYNYQRSADKTFTFYSSYTGDKYKLYFSAGINNLLSYENGGIIKISDLNQPNTFDVPTKLGALDKANSSVKNRNLLLVQRYTISSNPVVKNDSTSHKRSGFFGLSGTFSHIFILERNIRRYQDAFPNSGFYDTVFITKDITFDSIYSRTIKNTVRFDFTTDKTRKFTLGGGVGIRNEISTYSYIIPTHYTLSGTTAVLHENSNVLIGRLYNNIGDKFGWLATGELYVTGYRAGDFNLNGEISKSFNWKKGTASWLFTGSMMNRQPSIWYNHWGSNNFEWDKNLKKEFRIDLGSAFRYPARKVELKFNYAIIKNYADFDTTAQPSQYSGGLSVAAITLKNELRAWKFHLSSDVIIQKSSNSNILDLPLVTVRSAGYFEHLFRFVKTGGKLNTQLGVDVTYNTIYHPYAYMPATGRFYRQDFVTAGDYPFINVFLNFKVKRTRLFVMFDHINAKLMGYNYEMIPSYPMNIRMLRYGLAWTFYD